MNQVTILLLSLSLSFFGKDLTNVQDSTHVRSTYHKMTVAEVLQKYTQKWMEIPGVTGTGEGKSGGKPCVMVLIEHKSDLIKKKIPKTIDGYKVILEETGKIEAR